MSAARLYRDLPMTRHAIERADERAIPYEAVWAACEYGREVRCGQGRTAMRIDHRTAKQWRTIGVDLHHYLGVEAILLRDGSVLTVYRNRRGSARRRSRRRSAWRSW